MSLCLLLCAAAFAQTGISISPKTLNVGNVEEFMTISGSGLAGSVSTVVVFSGPGGTFSIEPNTINQTGTQIEVFIPILVAVNAGRYTVEVVATNATGVLRLGPVFFDVVDPDAGQQEGPPLLFIPEFVVAEAESSRGAAVTFEVSGFSQNGDELVANCTPGSGSNFPLGSTPVTCSTSNSFGSANGTFTVVVTDTTPPALTVPDDIVSENAVVTYTATADDAVSGNVPVTCSHASGSSFPSGTTTVTCTAIDGHGNFFFDSFNVTVTDGSPVLQLPGSIVAEATGPGGANVVYVATAIDGTVACAPASGSLFPLGTTMVLCSATNPKGTTSGTFSVTVQDTTPPALNAPDITAEAVNANGAPVNFTVTATDLVDGGPITATCTPPSSAISGEPFPIGVTVVECEASDTRFNVGQDVFNLTVADTTPPQATVTVSPATLWPPNHKMIPIVVTVTATDAVDPSPTSRIVSVSSNQPLNGTGDGDMAPDWIITGDLGLQLRAERAGNAVRIYTINVETKDLYGNITTNAVQVQVTNK